MSVACTKCGAVYTTENTCESIFYEFLALEFTDPDYYGRVHFLTVACYMIQHEGYSDEYYAWIQNTLRNYLEEGHTIQMILKDAAQSSGRTVGIRRSADAHPLPKISWSMTIADVAEQMNSAESYSELIEQLGRITLQEMGPIVGSK